jgi:hypothetical protein
MYASRKVLAAFLMLGCLAAVAFARPFPGKDPKVPAPTETMFAGTIENVRLGASPKIVVSATEVALTKDTLIAGSGRPMSIYDLVPGMAVTVYGYKNPRLGFVATKIFVGR